MAELYLHIKIYLDYFPGRLKYGEIWRVLYIEFQGRKLLRLYHNTYTLLFGIDLSTKRYQGL